MFICSIWKDIVGEMMKCVEDVANNYECELWEMIEAKRKGNLRIQINQYLLNSKTAWI